MNSMDPLNSSAYVDHLRNDLGAIRACLSEGDLTVPVEHCGDWTLHDLAEHMGRGNVWAATAVTERRGDHKAELPPRARAALVSWYDECATALLSALDNEPSTEAWTFAPPHTVGFWQRRRALETLVHRWDAEHALGTARPFDAALAADGVAEVFDTMAPFQVRRGRAAPPSYALRVTTTDVGGSWTYGPGDPIATLSGTAERLLLTLWGRIPRDDHSLTWDGDAAAGQRLLAAPLVP